MGATLVLIKGARAKILTIKFCLTSVFLKYFAEVFPHEVIPYCKCE